ncbi:MAG TPA: phosphotransferase [Myxococcota bacterium]|nr:phosphotransferase [Myxococcota bacterium]
MERARAWIETVLGRAPAELVPMPGGAGARRYWRVRFAGAASAVLMHAVREDPAILPPALRGEAAAALPFVEVTELLARHGVPVPKIFAVEPVERWILLEDLGDVRLLDLAPAERSERLRETIDLLARIHVLPREDALPFRRQFDAEWVRFELRTFAEHGLLERVRAELAGELDAFARAVAALPRGLALRDVQSQNLMVDPRGRLRVIDYQDALLAPPELDLAALLFDSYVELEPSERASLCARYWRARGANPDPARFALLVVQRKCKDYGRYRLMVEHRGDERYRPFIARAAQAVLSFLPSLPPAQSRLAEILRRALAEPRP